MEHVIKVFSFLIFFIEFWRGRERERERSISVRAKHQIDQLPGIDLGMCPKGVSRRGEESKRQRFGVRDNAKPTEQNLIY